MIFLLLILYKTLKEAFLCIREKKLYIIIVTKELNEASTVTKVLMWSLILTFRFNTRIKFNIDMQVPSLSNPVFTFQ